jgi:hypothetical protein
MSLDQYVYKCSGEPAINICGELQYPNVTKLKEWWGRHDIEGWMADLFYSKGGQGEFNCKQVYLEEIDLLWLLDAIVGNKLPSAFCHSKEVYDEEKEDDLKFIAEALTALAEGFTLYYLSWW